MDTTKRCILVQTKHLPLHMFSCSLFHAAYFFWFCLSPMPAQACMSPALCIPFLSSFDFYSIFR
jgi:hypothetical protein